MGKRKRPSGRALASMLTGNQVRHRICFDFTTVEAMQAFFGKCKLDGITHPSSAPILRWEQEGSTIWVVGLAGKDSDLIQKPG